MLQLFYPFINRVIGTVIEFILGSFHIGTIFDVVVVVAIYASFKLSEFGCGNIVRGDVKAWDNQGRNIGNLSFCS